MFKALSHSFYGDQTRWFIGKVVDNNDPLGLGRVRVNIIGIHDGINEPGDLPWASVVLPTTEGGLFTGFPPSLDTGAQIFGIFLDGIQSQLPLVIGSIPHILPDFSLSESGTAGGRYNSQDFASGQPGSYPGALEPVGTASESAELAYNFFRSINYSDAQARGIVGNMAHECANWNPADIGFDPNTRRDNGSMGICQWRLSRLDGPDGLKSWAVRNNLNPENISTQLRFTQYELDTFSYLGKAELMQCSTPEQATITFMRKFEIPRVEHGTTSAYRDPPYSTTGNFPPQRAGEADRLNYATTYQFNSRPVSDRGI